MNDTNNYRMDKLILQALLYTTPCQSYPELECLSVKQSGLGLTVWRNGHVGMIGCLCILHQCTTCGFDKADRKATVCKLALH